MKALLPVLLLCSCVGTVEMLPDGTVSVQAPVMARADRFAVNAKTQVGELRVMIVNGNAEAVPIAGINAATAIAAGKFALDAQKSDNALKATESTNALEATKSDNALKAVQSTAIPVPK